MASRTLRLVVLSRSGAIPIVIAAAIAPACGARSGLLGASTPPDAGVDASGGAAGAIAGAGGVGAGGTGGIAGAAGSPAQPVCQNAMEETYVIDLPPEGVPADPGQICAATADPVDSGRAAHVTLQKIGNTSDLSAATGFCAVDPALEARVVAPPIIEVVDATQPQLQAMQVTNLQKQPGGWSFDASFPAPLDIYPQESALESVGRMTVRITLELDCAPQPVTRIVHAATDIHVCADGDQVVWASSGDSCTVCRVIAEMAPSPIVPDHSANAGDLPLARALRLRLVELARIADTVVLLAEHDGGAGLEYEWHASGGQVRHIAPDVVVWTLEDGVQAPFIQAAVHGPSALAVASFGFNEAA